MRALLGEDWTEGLADGHRRSHEYRIQVEGLLNLAPVEGLYPARGRGRDLRMAWNYLREIGPRATARKVLSRTRERFRNAKFVSCGFGRVLEAPLGGAYREGERVVFLVPAGGACTERVVLPEALLLDAEDETLPTVAPRRLAYHAAPETPGPAWWQSIEGWHVESGRELSPAGTAVLVKEAREAVRNADWTRAIHFPLSDDAPSTTLPARANRHASASGRPRAILFGYGNYAKTVAMPGLKPHLEIDRIHELDPFQIPQKRAADTTWDSSPELPDERHDAVIVAGYHHTHADLAIEALERGSHVLVEKPITTTRPQLHRLLAAMRRSEGQIFSGYQRRYLPFNAMAREDLGVDPGDPISYHAVVFEVPLPALHWYRWPNSRSRLLSNGCHWLDHFLYLNEFAAVTEHQLALAPDGQLNASVTLENGAFFTMVLTDSGSRRLGVRDHVELRAGGTTITIEDQSRYHAENASRILRRKRIPRLDAYRRMYGEIGRRMANDEPGDSVISLRRSAGLVLDLEERLVAMMGGQETPAAERPARPAQRIEPVVAAVSA